MCLGASANFGKQSVCVMLELQEYIGLELQKEASIAKGRLKAHELLPWKANKGDK